MADPVVHITNGIPDSGTGNITTLGQTLTDGANATLGANADAASATGSISAKLRALVTAIGTTAWDLGSGTGGSRTQRVILDTSNQNANGTTTDSNSTPVAWSTEGKAQVGSLTETAPASDTASSGLNGRLQRIAQNITTLIAATLKVALQTTTAGGCAVLRKIDLDETPVAVKAAAGQVYGFYVVNRTTSPRFLRFYNIASGSVTVGTSTVAAGPFEIPANANDHTVVLSNLPNGVEFSAAISMAATTGFADNDTGAPGTNDLIVNVFYK